MLSTSLTFLGFVRETESGSKLVMLLSLQTSVSLRAMWFLHFYVDSLILRFVGGITIPFTARTFP